MRSSAYGGLAAVAVLAVALLCVSFVSGLTATDGASLAAQFAAFTSTYGKTYATAQEEQLRRHYFAENMARMAELQARNPHATFAVNRLFDLSSEEFHRRYASGGAFFKARRASWGSGAWPGVERVSSVPLADNKAAETLDWRTSGMVSPVKDQGNCGSCWAFSAVGNIESMWAKAGHPMTLLSEQQLVSCDDVDFGCSGGLMDQAYQWLIDNTGGVVYTQESYPYVSGSGFEPACDTGPHEFGAAIVGYAMVDSNEDLIAQYLATNGPLSIALDASAFLSYESGIITECFGRQLNHGVLLVGYNMTGEVPYWIIKNSWGTDWGESGYVRVRFGSNECLMADEVMTARVADGPPTTKPPAPGSTAVVRSCCNSYRCTNCTSEVMATNVCIASSADTSRMLQCGFKQLVERIYKSPDCSGSPEFRVTPLDKCMISWHGSSTDTCIHS